MDRVNAKPKLATTWLGGCSGCHMSFLDLDEHLIDLAGLVDVVYSPVVDAKIYPDEVDIVLIEGAVANDEHLRHVRDIRRKTRVLIAFGDCAVTGNVTAMRNLFSVEDCLQRAYVEQSSTVTGVPPNGTGILPTLLPRVLRVEDVVKVDYYLPGCPPSAAAILEFVTALLEGRTPVAEGRRFGS